MHFNLFKMADCNVKRVLINMSLRVRVVERFNNEMMVEICTAIIPSFIHSNEFT
jgi:hypothetical protein